MFKIIIILILTLSPATVLAQVNSSLDIKINVKQEVAIEDNLEFNYKITSNESQTISYIPRIECPSVLMPMMEVVDLELEKGISVQDIYFSASIKNYVEPQTCKAVIEIIEPFHQVTEEEFKIVTDPVLNVDVLLCQDKDCLKKSTVYKQGDIGFFVFLSNVKNIKSIANISSPSGKEAELIVPGQYVFEENGEYAISVLSSATGHESNVKRFSAVALSSDIAFNDRRICNADKVCSEPETIKNCPQDCAGLSEVRNNKNIILISVIICLVIFVLVIIFYIKKKNINNTSDNNSSNTDNKEDL